MEVKEKVFCELYDFEYEEIHRKIDADFGKDADAEHRKIEAINKVIARKIQEAFDQGRKFEQDKITA